jgi:hypothetical protein
MDAAWMQPDVLRFVVNECHWQSCTEFQHNQEQAAAARAELGQTQAAKVQRLTHTTGHETKTTCVQVQQLLQLSRVLRLMLLFV